MSRTRQTILALLNHRGSLAANAIARAIGLSKMATRYHLRLLARDGLIITQTTQHPHQVGRPETVYSLAEPAYDCLPCRYNQLAEHLLDSLTNSLGEQETQRLLRHAGRQQADQAQVGDSPTVDSRMSRVVRFLNRRGYACRTRRHANATKLIISNCPYRQVARSHPHVCEMDIEMVKTLLDMPARLSECMASGQTQCQFVIGNN